MGATSLRFLFSALLLFFGLSRVSAEDAPERKQRETLGPDGKLRERYAYYLDEKGKEVRDGEDVEFYPDGSQKGTRIFKRGLEDGAVVYFHPNGRKSYETNYSLGRKNGFSTVWYQNGQKQWQTTFREGKTNGRWREWYMDGKKKFEADYNDGKLDGVATWWYDNGRIWQERAYENGVPVKGRVKEWDRNGRQTFPPMDGSPAAEEPEAQPVQSRDSSRPEDGPQLSAPSGSAPAKRLKKGG